MICNVCGTDANRDDCRVVVIDTDTSGTLLIRPITDDRERREAFEARYHALVDSGRYPNMSSPQIECKACRGLRYREMEEEAEYWRRKHGYYDDED